MRWQGVFQISLILAVLFTASILFLEPILAQVSLLPDQGASWYYWKLPEPQLVSQISAWSGYLLHQVFIWSVIAWAQNHRQQLRRPTPGLHKINYIALLGSAFFIGLHMLQTATFYDGLAQDMSVFSSQASVVLVLVIVLLLEAPRRGLLLGHGKSWFAHIRPTLVRYHGYYFSWAVVYTFWFHPMETSWGHLLGFFYTFMLLIQAGFIFTPVHTNRYWTLALELGVLVHGVTVALVAGQEFWPMFAFGFLLVFIITQMHGIGLSIVSRWGLAALLVILIIWVYQFRGWQNLHEILRIPIIDYVLVLLIAGLLSIRRLYKPNLSK